MTSLGYTANKTFLQQWGETASQDDLLFVLADARFTKDDLISFYEESCFDLQQNGMESSGFKGWLQWKFNCAVATSDADGLKTMATKTHLLAVEKSKA